MKKPDVDDKRPTGGSAPGMTPALHGQMDQFVAFALEHLARMYRPERGLFCFKMVERNGRMVAVDVSVRYTAICLLGLCRAQQCGHALPLSPDQALDALLLSIEQPLPMGDLGLVLWAAAARDPARAGAVLSQLQRRWDELREAGRRDLSSMEVQWMLSALCALQRCSVRSAQAESLTQAMHDELIRLHYNPDSGLFFYASRQPRSARKRLARSTCYFAEQVYGVHALQSYARLTGDCTAADYARRTVQRLCACQSANGGWPWLFDVRTGAVIDRYPVYTVHQLGMAPMAMLALARTGDEQISRAITRGVSWVCGDNELGRPMLERERGVIWRSIKPRRLARPRHLLHKALATVGCPSVCGQRWLQPRAFQIDRECRPYELGWLLYAWCDAGETRLG